MLIEIGLKAESRLFPFKRIDFKVVNLVRSQSVRMINQDFLFFSSKSLNKDYLTFQNKNITTNKNMNKTYNISLNMLILILPDLEQFFNRNLEHPCQF